MKCYYEVLSVSRDASDFDIKTAYRKLALKWHPDKNLDNSQLAKEQFQIVQQAYEVLSDRQERAWYDNHREQILRGCNSDFLDNSLDVFSYFTTSCFHGYGDDENGFYMVYRLVFETIAKEDMEFMQDKEDFLEVPSFGNSETDYEKVSEFYSYWLNYSTKKSYVWLDPHDIVGIKERKYIKLVEKENKKARQKAKKERNEEVRNLVAFVKKRDKRVQEQKKIQEQKLLENKKKRELLTKQKRIERRQELSEYSGQPEWSKFDNVKCELEMIEKNLAEQFGEELTDSEDDEQDKDFSNLYCIACNKIFKTSKAFENHELSKKHKDNTAALKKLIKDENDEIEGETSVEEDNLETNGETLGDIYSDSEVMDSIIRNKEKKKKKPRNVLSVDLQDETHDLITSNLDLESETINDNLDFGLNKKKKIRNKKNGDKMVLCNETILESENNDEIKKVNKGKRVKKECEDKSLHIDTDHNCVTCKSSFPSKNKLFDHLKKTGHGVYLSSNSRSKKKNVSEK